MPVKHNRFKVFFSSLRRQILIGIFALLIPLVTLAGAGYYIYLNTVASFDSVMDDVFLHGLPVGEVRELLFQVSLPVTNHLISSHAEERDKYIMLKEQINEMLENTIDAKTDDLGLMNKEIIKQANIEWQAAMIYSDNLVLLRDEINDEQATRLFNQFDHHLGVAAAEVRLYHQNINQVIINKRGSVDKQLKNVRYISIFIIMIAFLVSAVIIIFFIKNVVIPLQVIERGTMQFGHGDFSHRIEIEPRNELGKLVVTFNSMADKLEEIATRDSLTKLLNKKAILEILNSELARARRHDSTLGLMMLDLDYFKNINDTYGHQAGDLVLQRFAGQLKKMSRPYDLVARYGGEEFILCFPKSDNADSASIAERIRKTVEEMMVNLPDTSQSVKITASFGTASFVPEFEEDVDAVIKRADDALYRAKDEGRNRVCVADPK